MTVYEGNPPPPPENASGWVLRAAPTTTTAAPALTLRAFGGGRPRGNRIGTAEDRTIVVFLLVEYLGPGRGHFGAHELVGRLLGFFLFFLVPSGKIVRLGCAGRGASFFGCFLERSLFGIRIDGVCRRLRGFLVHAGLDGGVVPLTKGKNPWLYADERIVFGALLEERGKPCPHGHFGALADVTQQVFLDGEVGDLFVVKRSAHEAEHFRRGFGKCHLAFRSCGLLVAPVRVSFRFSKRARCSIEPHSTRRSHRGSRIAPTPTTHSYVAVSRSIRVFPGQHPPGLWGCPGAGKHAGRSGGRDSLKGDWTRRTGTLEVATYTARLRARGSCCSAGDRGPLRTDGPSSLAAATGRGSMPFARATDHSHRPAAHPARADRAPCRGARHVRSRQHLPPSPGPRDHPSARQREGARAETASPSQAQPQRLGVRSKPIERIPSEFTGRREVLYENPRILPVFASSCSSSSEAFARF